MFVSSPILFHSPSPHVTAQLLLLIPDSHFPFPSWMLTFVSVNNLPLSFFPILFFYLTIYSGMYEGIDSEKGKGETRKTAYSPQAVFLNTECRSRWISANFASGHRQFALVSHKQNRANAWIFASICWEKIRRRQNKTEIRPTDILIIITVWKGNSGILWNSWINIKERKCRFFLTIAMSRNSGWQ